MKHTRRHAAFAAIVAALLLGGCAAQARETQEMLSAAGFQMRPGEPPAQLPERKLYVEQRNGQPVYVYADPKYCHCTYVGDEKAHQEFQRLRIQKEISDQQLAASENYRDWMWGPPWGPAWGPWGWW